MILHTLPFLKVYSKEYISEESWWRIIISYASLSSREETWIQHGWGFIFPSLKVLLLQGGNVCPDVLLLKDNLSSSSLWSKEASNLISLPLPTSIFLITGWPHSCEVVCGKALSTIIIKMRRFSILTYPEEKYESWAKCFSTMLVNYPIGICVIESHWDSGNQQLAYAFVPKQCILLWIPDSSSWLTWYQNVSITVCYILRSMIKGRASLNYTQDNWKFSTYIYIDYVTRKRA